MNRSHSQNASDRQIFLFPRRKLGQKVTPHKGRRPMAIDLAVLEKYFHLPQNKASIALGISLTALKQLCRKLGVTRWPYQRKKKDRRCSRKKKTEKNLSKCPSMRTPAEFAGRTNLATIDRKSESSECAALSCTSVSFDKKLGFCNSLRPTGSEESTSATALEFNQFHWRPINREWIEWYMSCEDSIEV